MNKVILYIKDTYGEYQRVDLFDDETISVTSKIQDIKDVSKIFTDFSQSFTLPASKTNNKIFAHFYNYFLDGQTSGTQEVGVFDARSKKDAVLEINYIPFRRGKIFLNGVKMKENKPYAYNITFFGNTVNLKDLFGDDKLQALDWLNNFNHSWDNDTVRNGFTTGLSTTIGSSTKTNAIIYPLITPTKRLFYDSSNNNSSTLTGNISYDAGGGGVHLRGIDYTDLKPAIRLQYVIEAIEEKYGIEFTDDFFHNFTSDYAMYNLYMWLSREKGKIPAANPESILNNFTYSSGTGVSGFYPSGEVYFENSGALTNSNLRFFLSRQFAYNGNAGRYNEFVFNLTITPKVGSTTQVYGVKMIDTLNNDEVLQEFSDLTGTQTITFSTGRESSSSRIYSVQWIVLSDTGFESTESMQIIENIKRVRGGVLDDSFTAVYNPDDVDTSFDIVITERVPDIKVYDFMTGLFKMFNLTAYYVDDVADADFGKIRVLPLDEFYDDNPQIFDITKYVDSSETDIDATIPFSEIEFKYKDPKTLLMLQHKEEFNDIFGDSEYAPQDVDRGKPYKVELPFEHLKFERLEDEDTGDLTEYQWGYSAGDNFKPDAEATPPTGDYDSVLTAPILFYGIRRTGLSSTPLSWLENSTHDDLISYWMPSNASERVTGASVIYGTANGTSAFRLIDTSQPYLGSASSVGDIVYNTTDNTQTTVVSIVSSTELELADDIFVSGEDYEVVNIPNFTLNFDIEVDEYSRRNFGTYTRSLFKVFYETYITDAFNPKKRIFKLTAHLPNSILLNYNLNDRFQIGDKVFTINSIDTNLKTGESKLELLNVL
jgi:hypothetical protein